MFQVSHNLYGLFADLIGTKYESLVISLNPNYSNAYRAA